MSMLREAAQQALEALKEVQRHRAYTQGIPDAITALRDALAQPLPDPVDKYRKGFIDGQIDMRARLEEQEPVVVKDSWGLTLKAGWHDLPIDTKLYTHPPRREWRNLTMQEINALPEIGGVMWRMGTAPAVLRAIRAVEAKLKEKNHG